MHRGHCRAVAEDEDARRRKEESAAPAGVVMVEYGMALAVMSEVIRRGSPLCGYVVLYCRKEDC
jgi:hypothetical protein